MTKDELEVKNLLLEFMKERNRWDVESYNELIIAKDANLNTSDVFVQFRPKLQSIYDKFLSDKERKYTSSFNSISSNPSYDPAAENIEEIITKNKNRIVIRTIKKDIVSERPNEYVFIKQNSVWKLDNKKTYWKFKEKWESTQL
ncbi:MAG: NTF2 fold immunity protein [Saprospiraceae bacterium]